MVVDDGTVRRFHRQLLVATGSIALFASLRLTVDGVVSVPPSSVLTPSIGLAIPLGVLFGAPAVVGVVVGLLLTQIVQAGLSFLVVFDAAAVFVLTAVPAAVWHSRISLWRENRFDIEGVTGFVVLSVTTSVAAASLLAWGSELLGLFPFYVIFVETLLRYLLGTVIVAPPVFLVVLLLQQETEHSPPPRELGAGFLLVPFLWAFLAFVGSLGFNVRERIQQFVFEQHGVEFLYYVFHPDTFGQGGRRVQVVFGAFMLVAWAVSLRVFLFEDTQGNPSEETDEEESMRSTLDSDGTGVSNPEEMEVQ